MRKINDDKHGERGQVVRDELLYKLCLNHEYASLKKADKGLTQERITGVYIVFPASNGARVNNHHCKSSCGFMLHCFCSNNNMIT